MANPEITCLLAECQSPKKGCFASDQDALECMLYFGDSGIRTTLQRVASAADEAAVADIPFEQATYNPATIEIIGIETVTGLDGEDFDVNHAVIGSGDLQRIAEPAENDYGTDVLRLRVAKCAYACGATAIGCPLRTSPAAS